MLSRIGGTEMEALYVAGQRVADPMSIWRGYGRRTLDRYDLPGSGRSDVLTPAEAWRTRVVHSRLTRGEQTRLLARADTAPWSDVPADAELLNADPNEQGGLFHAAANLYWHFSNPRMPGFGPPKLHKVLHVKRPKFYPVVDTRIQLLYRQQALAWARRLARVMPQASAGGSIPIWAAFRDDLVENATTLKCYRRELEDDPATAALANLSLVRLLDIVGWQLAG
jgi:hypothetical protein